MKKYVSAAPVTLPDRQWPSKRLEAPPVWCSVDLRDGNQALIEPMNVEEKIEMFHLLTRMGFKEIEVGFPSASQIEFDTVRTLIERNLIPPDVTIQVLTQAREHLIRRTYEAIEGAKNVIVHLYTNVSPMFQKAVYKTTRRGIVDIAVREIELLRMLAEMREDGGEGVRFEYSPECFSESEPRLTMLVLSSVVEHFGATPEKKLIVNLPSTVQKSTPNEFADRVEYVHRFLPGRENVILSVHPHNDRGTGIAEAEMALLAGAERVEGTLFGKSVIPYTLLYYIANTTVFWSAGFALMRRWGGATPQARRLPPAPLVVFFVCVGLIFARFSPPAFLLSACGYLGNLVTPLSLLFIGAVMMRMIRARSFRWERGYLAAAVGRFVVSPGLLLAAAALLNVTGIMRDVLMVQAAMPVMSQTALVAASTGSDEEYAAGGTALTTAMSLALIPVYMFLIERVL